MIRSPIPVNSSPNHLSVGSFRQQQISDTTSLLRSCSATDVMAESDTDSSVGCNDDLPALTQTIRFITQALGNLKTTVSSDSPRDGLQDEAKEKLTVVLSTIKTTFVRFPRLHTADILKAMQMLICKIESGDFDGSSRCREEILGVIDNVAFLVSNSLSDCLALNSCEVGNHLSKTKSLNCLAQNEAKAAACELSAEGRSNPRLEQSLSAGDILDDSMLYKLESGVEIALSCAQSWSKYAKELTSYVERRINLWGDFVRSLTKLAKSVEQAITEDSFLPMQQLFCEALSQDIELASMSQAARSLILNQTFVSVLNSRRTEHDKIRKSLKYMWTKQVRKLHDSISNLRKAKTTYISRQQDYEKIKELALKAENESHLLSTSGTTSTAKADAKMEKKKKQEDEAMQKAVEAETAYKQCVRDANEQQKQLEEVKCHVLRMIRALLVDSDAILKESTSGYFKLMNTIMETIPQQFHDLNCQSQKYDQGSHYLEYISQLRPSDHAPAEIRTFAFEPYIMTIKLSDQLDNQSDSFPVHRDTSRNDSDSSPGGSTLSLESPPTSSPFHSKRVVTSSSMADLATTGCDEDHSKYDLGDDAPTTFRGVRLSLDAQSHILRKLRAPSKCVQCDSLVYLQGAECEKCGVASHKKCLEFLRVSCSGQADVSRGGTGTISLDTSMREVPFILIKCIQEIDRRGLNTKGIYRISSVKSRVEQVCHSFEYETNVDIGDQPPNIIANVLKLYLRQLPEPLLTFKLYGDFIDVAKEEVHCSSIAQLLTSLNQVVEQLPPIYLKTCNMLMHHLNRVSKNHEMNQMTSGNLGIVFGPTLLKPKDGAASINYLIETPYQTRIIELMIDHAQAIFGPDEGPVLEEALVMRQPSADVRRKRLAVRGESGSDSTSPGYSSWYAPEITQDLLGELAKEQPHFLSLQEGHLLPSDSPTSGHHTEEPAIGQRDRATDFKDSDNQTNSSITSEEKIYFM